MLNGAAELKKWHGPADNSAGPPFACKCPRAPYSKAGIPVSSRPMISFWIWLVPS